MSQAKIPPNVHATVMKLADDGQTGEQIADLLGREHQIEVSSRAVQRLVAQHRTEQANAAKAVVREELRRRLVPVVRRMALAINRARR